MLQLIELLEHPTLSEAAVAAFDVISIEFPQLHLPVVKHFFKQKLFQLFMKCLWHKLEKYSENHLSAFVFVLKMTPHQVLVNEIDKIGPVLLKCLTLNKTKSILTAMNICLRFVHDQNEYFRDHLQNLIPRCLKLSTYQDSMVRIIIHSHVTEDFDIFFFIFRTFVSHQLRFYQTLANTQHS